MTKILYIDNLSLGKKIMICLLLMACGNTYCQKTSFGINLLDKKEYKEEAPKQYDMTKDYVPYIQVFLPEKEKATGQAVLICPGGGYGMVAFGHEGLSWAEFFNAKGFAVVVLKYRIPKGDRTIPLADAVTALQIIKENATSWNIDAKKVGIMGFSAGGHLASTIVTQNLNVQPLAFQILFYPVITMDKSYTHIGSHDSLLGKNASKVLEDQYSNEKHVSEKSPQAFIVLAQDDQVVSPDNSINYYRALTAKKVPASLHVYPTGNHGWGYSRRYKYNAVILEELGLWISNLN